MTDKDVTQEIEANERRAAEQSDDRENDGPGNVITYAVDTIFAPVVNDRPDEDEEAARRAENDREQRPE